jgi:hypothetical protein
MSKKAPKSKPQGKINTRDSSTAAFNESLTKKKNSIVTNMISQLTYFKMGREKAERFGFDNFFAKGMSDPDSFQGRCASPKLIYNDKSIAADGHRRHYS